MSIDEDKQDSTGSDGSVFITVDVHNNPSKKRSSPSKDNSSKRKRHERNNNNDADVVDDGVFLVQETYLDKNEVEPEGNSKLTESDIANLKVELILAQEEAKLAKKEAAERRVQLENTPGIAGWLSLNWLRCIEKLIDDGQINIFP